MTHRFLRAPVFLASVVAVACLSLGACSGPSARIDGDDPDGGPPFIQGINPVIEGDVPDPHVLRHVGVGGKLTYYLSATSDTGDFPVFESSDLVTWTKRPQGLFGKVT